MYWFVVLPLIVFLQSGGEESRKSRLSDGASSSAKNNGEVIDYKALYEATKWVFRVCLL